MRFFWPIYLLSSLAGTAGVYFVAPYARPYVPAFLKRTENAPQGISPSLVEKTVPAGTTERPVERREPADPTTTDATAGMEGKPLEEMPPALNGIYLVQRGERPGWGVTHQRTVYYTLEGVRAGTVEGGVLLDFRGTRNSSKGGMVECVLYENGTPSAPLLVGVKDVFLFTGDVANLSTRQREALQSYYEINGKIVNRKNELLQAAAVKNPFFEAYQTAHKALMAHIDLAQALLKERDRATEQEKTRIEDRLREMKIDENKLRAEYDATHLKFRTWKQAHASEIAQPENDPAVKQWIRQKTDLIAQIPGLAY